MYLQYTLLIDDLGSIKDCNSRVAAPPTIWGLSNHCWRSINCLTLSTITPGQTFEVVFTHLLWVSSGSRRVLVALQTQNNTYNQMGKYLNYKYWNSL